MKKALLLLTALILALGLITPLATSAQANTISLNTVDTSWQKTTNWWVESTWGSTLYGCDDPFWEWTSDVWDGLDTNPSEVVIPDFATDFWATWSHKGEMWTQSTHQWFKTTLTLPCTAQLTKDIKLVSANETPDILTINDSLYVYVNGQYAASGGTASHLTVYPLIGSPPLPAGFVTATPSYPPYSGSDWAPASDTGWYIDGGLTLPMGLFHPGDNSICVMAEEFNTWGGLGHLVFSNVEYELPDVCWLTPTENADITLKCGCFSSVPIKFQLKTQQTGTLITDMQNIYLTVTGPSYSYTWQSGKGLGKLLFCKGTYMATICQDKKNPLESGDYVAAVYDGCSDILLGAVPFSVSSAGLKSRFHKIPNFKWSKDKLHFFFKGKWW